MSFRKFELLLENCSQDSPVGRLIQIRNWKKPNKNPKVEQQENISNIRRLQRARALRS